jgi:hypothetical protein
LVSMKKSGYLISYFNIFSFGSFQIKSRKKINLKILRSKMFWGMKKD